MSARRRWWELPVPLDPAQRRALWALCLISLLWSYGGGFLGLLAQTLPYAADLYSVGDSSLATGLAVVRAGAVIALVLGPLADRRGRRRLVVSTAIVHCLLAATLGLAPSFEVYIAGHVVLRCVDTALSIAITVLVAELVPAGSRATALGIVALATGAGVVLAVLALPLAESGEAGFAAAYGLQLLALPLILLAARALPESPRFLRHAAERHGYRAFLQPPYLGRMLLIGSTSFLAAFFTGPVFQFTTRLLDDTHGFSSLQIIAFLAVTGLPAAPMVVVGGRLADGIGRKPVGIPLLAISLVAYAGFYLAPAPWIWPLALIGAMAGAAGGAAIAPYGTELFPTRIRSSAQSLMFATAVTGSAAGLGCVALLTDELGLGGAVAALAALPAIALVILAVGFPETVGQELEDTSGDAPLGSGNGVVAGPRTSQSNERT